MKSYYDFMCSPAQSPFAKQIDMPTQTRQESPSYRDRALPIDERVSDLLSRIERTGSTQLSADVVNVGDRSGTEVVQLYIRDRVSSVTRPVKELKAFQRVSL